MKSKFIETNRGRFHYLDNEETAHFPIVMIHGWPESSYCWHSVIPALTGSFRIICPDLRGLGDSVRTPAPEAYLKSELAKDMLQLLDDLEIEDFYLIGHDWGGAVAQEIAFLIPDRIKKLVILNISIINNAKGNRAGQDALNRKGNYSSWYQHFQQQPGLAEAMIPGNEALWLKRTLLAISTDQFPEGALQEYIRCYSIPGTAKAGANYYRTFREDIKRWQSFVGKKFPMPALYIYGNQDKVVIPAFLKHIEDCFESILLKQTDAAGHFIMEEQPLFVAQCLNEFL